LSDFNPAIAARAVEEIADDLLRDAQQSGPAEIFADAATDDPARCKAAADLLVSARFARFADDGRTQIEITNAGRYWALNGGYLAFLKEEPASVRGGAGRQRNPELEALRLNYMRLRLNTFWWTFGLSIVSLVVSLISLTVASLYGGILR